MIANKKTKSKRRTERWLVIQQYLRLSYTHGRLKPKNKGNNMQQLINDLMAEISLDYNNEIVILGCDRTINWIDRKKLEGKFIIGVNEIYHSGIRPNILFWTDPVTTPSQIKALKETEASLKICVTRAAKIPGCIVMPERIGISDEWRGGLMKNAPAIPTAIHLAMMLTDKITIAGVGYPDPRHFYDKEIPEGEEADWIRNLKILNTHHPVYYYMIWKNNKNAKILFNTYNPKFLRFGTTHELFKHRTKTIRRFIAKKKYRPFRLKPNKNNVFSRIDTSKGVKIGIGNKVYVNITTEWNNQNLGEKSSTLRIVEDFIKMEKMKLNQKIYGE